MCSPPHGALRRASRLAFWLVLSVTAAARAASGQGLPEAPISLAGGHVVLGAEVTATIAPDDPGFFNYTSYEFSALRNLRMGVSAEIRANDHLQVLGEVRFDQGRVLEAYGLFVRVRPFPSRRFDIQAGRIPPTFGAMTRTAYGSGNLLIGQPLAYQYLTSIRADALPATSADLLRMRGRGWLSNFQVGNRDAGPGLPLVNTSRWDTGIQAHGITGVVEWTGSVTTGSLSDPRFRDNNSGRQFAGRAVVRPITGAVIGVSASRGAWLNQSLEEEIAVPDHNRGQQVAFGGDAEFSAGRFLVRGEAIRSAWSMPVFGSLALAEPLVAISTLLEGRYKIAPGLYVAARGDRLDFSAIRSDRGLTDWDAQTWRFETGIGYSLTRNIIVKVAWQKNGRDGGRIRKDALTAAQVLYWF
ncbi:MAG TPA: hypothetical protein VEA16_04535 [Vicinamibacterales bacterium]|nr:hypothetical protein [Vicinamibacterales bacterium]